MSSKRSNEEQYSSISDHLGDKWTPPKCTMIEILQFCSSISKTQSVDTGLLVNLKFPEFVLTRVSTILEQATP